MSTENRVHHINLMVDDISRAVEFYGTALGLDTVPTPDMGFPAQFFRIKDLGKGPTAAERSHADVRT